MKKRIKGMWYPGTEVFTVSKYKGSPDITGWVETLIDPKIDTHVIVIYINEQGKRDFHMYFMSEVFRLNKINWCEQLLKMMESDHDINSNEKKEIPVQVHTRIESGSQTDEEQNILHQKCETKTASSSEQIK